MEFMGKSPAYWVEIDRRVQEERLDTDLLQEVVRLKGKISLYESRIEQMNMIRIKDDSF